MLEKIAESFHMILSTRYTTIIIFDTGMHQILKATVLKYTGIL